MPTTFTILKPAPFWTVRSQRLDLVPQLCGLCVGYETNAWRLAAFVDHLMEWLPEFALTPAEWQSMNHANAVAMIRRAALAVYQTGKFANRGEFGELMLHAAIRQVHDSLPAISKIYYKSAVNDTVKGFDAVHVVGPPNDMELWLGEVKFYDEVGKAISDVVAELETHLGTDYLRQEFLLIGNKMDSTWPHSAQLAKLLSPNTSLDDVFQRICIPVLLTYDSACVNGYTQASKEYVAAFEAEMAHTHERFRKSLSKRTLPATVRVKLFLLPLNQKSQLITALDQKLRKWQEL